MSRALRRAVPLKAMCSRKWAIPFCSGRSCRPPAPTRLSHLPAVDAEGHPGLEGLVGFQLLEATNEQPKEERAWPLRVFLQKLGCTFAQGLLFGDPMSSDSFLELLLSQAEGTDSYRALFA